MLRRAARIHLNELKLPGNHAVVPSLVNSPVLNGVLQIKERPNFMSGIIRVHQHGATFQEIAIPLQDEIDRCGKQRLPGTYESGQRLAGNRPERFLEGDSLILEQDRLAYSDEAVALTNQCRAHE